MSALDKAIMQLGLESVQLAAEHKAVKAENERLRERVKDLERHLADAYARIAEVAKVGKWTPDGTFVYTDDIIAANARVRVADKLAEDTSTAK